MSLQVVKPKLNLKSAQAVRDFFTRPFSNERILITPDLATAILENCQGANRSVSDNRVQAYAADMSAGKWRRTHQGIAFSTAGTLLDGQHRMWAIISSGVPIEMAVHFGLESEAMLSIDQGRSRSVTDVFKIKGKAEANRMVANARAMAALIGEGHLTTYDQVIAFQARFTADLEWALTLPRTMPAPARGAFAFAHKADPFKVEQLAERVISGVGFTSQRDPALLLRNLLMERGGSPRHGNQKLATTNWNIATKTLRAIAAHMYNEQLSVLQEGKDIVVFFARIHNLDTINGEPIPTRKNAMELKFASMAKGAGKP